MDGTCRKTPMVASGRAERYHEQNIEALACVAVDRTQEANYQMSTRCLRCQRATTQNKVIFYISFCSNM